MFATITELAYWKSEHDEQSCEDAFAVDPAAGLFVVADGVGTAVFSNIWAKIIAKHFLTRPLLSSDRFEVDWWIRPAQEEYKKQSPDPMALPLGARKKAQEGSFTTLVALRLLEIEANVVSAQLLAFGDSCVLVHRGAPGKRGFSFPLEKAADFERAPVCLPSFLKRFDRMFTTCLFQLVTFEPGDQVILASDAVAKWVIGGAGRGERFYADAFVQVASQTLESWPGFIQARRDSGEMADDDVTAIVMTFSQDGADGGAKLDVTTGHSPEIQEERRKALEYAKAQADKELLAITFGDGGAFGCGPDTLPKEIEEARHVADALNEVLQALRGAINSPDLRAIIEPLWKKHQATLEHESCAREIIESLHQIGILGASAPGQAGSERLPAPASVALEEQAPVAYRAADQQEGKALLTNFLLACHDDNDQAIVAAYEAILHSPLRATIALKAGDEARARQSQERLKRLAQVHPMTPQEMVTAIAAESGSRQQFSPEEREQLELAQDFVHAWQNSDDEAIRQAYDAIQRSRYHAAFNLALYEQRVQAAAPSAANLTYLEKALQQGTPLDIASEFHTLQITLDALPGSMRQVVEPAITFARAYHDSDAEANTELLTAYEQMMQSDYRDRLHLDEAEWRRLEQARQSMQGHAPPQFVWGWVNEHPITPAMANNLDTLKDWYISFRNLELGRRTRDYPDYRTEIEMEMQDLKEVGRARSSEVLLEDFLIQEGMEEESREAPLFDVQRKIAAIFPDFQRHVSAQGGLQGSRLQQLSEQEVQEVLGVFVRRRLFARHLYQHGTKLRDWLKKKRKQANVHSNIPL